MNSGLLNLSKPVPFLRSLKSMSTHNQIVSFFALSLSQHGYDVRADHIRWPYGSPDKMYGYRPDIVAEKNGVVHVFEVETLDSYMTQHTFEQLRAFSRFGFQTHVILPVDFGPNYQIMRMKNALNRRKLDVSVGSFNPTTKEVQFYI